MYNQEDLPAIKLRNNLESANPAEPIVIVSGRDLVGMPHAVAFTAEEAEMVGRDLFNLAASIKAARGLQAEKGIFKSEGEALGFKDEGGMTASV